MEELIGLSSNSTPALTTSTQSLNDAQVVLDLYNEHLKNGTLTQENWNSILEQSTFDVADYLVKNKGLEASMVGFKLSLEGSVTGLKKVCLALNEYNSYGEKSSSDQKLFAKEIGKTNGSLSSYLLGLNGVKASLGGYVTSLIASTAQTIALNVAVTALNAALTMGIGVAISIASAAFTKWINKSKEVAKAAENAKDSIKSIREELSSNVGSVNEAKERYAELAQNVENLGKANQSKGTLSDEDYKEFLNTSNQLADIFPSLTVGYDENGNALLNLAGNVDTIVSSLDSLLEKEKEVANQKIMEEFPDVFSGAMQNIDELKKKVQDAQDEFDRYADMQYQVINGGSRAFDNRSNGVGTFTNYKGDTVFQTVGSYTGLLDELGIAYKTAIIENGAGTLVQIVGDANDALIQKVDESRNALQSAKDDLKTETSSISQYLNTWLQTEFTYQGLNDSGLQNAVQNMLLNFDFSNLPDGVDSNWASVSEYLRNNILQAIYDAQNDPEISTALSQVFTNAELDPNEKADFLEKIKNYFGEDSEIVVTLKPVIDDTTSLQKSYNDAINKFGDSGSGKLENFFKKKGINTQEEIDYWNKVTAGATNATVAIQKYAKAKSSDEVTKPFTKSEMISEINGLSEGFEELDKIMASVVDKDKAFDFSLLDDKKFKDNFQDYTKEYNNFIETITKHPKDIKACQSAFDDLTTAYLYNSDVMKGLSDDTADVAAQYLKLMGVSNSEEVVASALAQKHAEAAWNSRDLSNATADEIDALANESEQTDQNRESFKLYIAQKILASDAFDPTGDITALSKIVESLGIASNAWIKYNALRNQILQMDATAHVSNGRTYYSYTSKDKNGNTVNHLATQEEYDNYNKQMENQLNDFSDDITAKLKADMRVSNTGGNKTSNKNSSNSKGKTKKDPTTFDWMERKLTILDKQTSTLQDKIDNLVGYKAKNQVTDTVLDLLGDKLTTLEKMSAHYQEQLNSIDLPEEWIEEIQSGAYDIDSLDSDKDKKLIKKIQDYQTWYDKIQDCKDKIDETTKSIKEMNLSKLDNIIDQFDQTRDILSQIIDTEKDLLDLREQQGEKISANDYISLANKQYEATKQNIEEYNRLSAEMSKLNLKRGSEEWKKYNDQLQDLKDNMIAAADAVESYKDAMTELVYKDLDDYKNKLDSLNGTIGTMSGLIGDTNLVDDNGELTDRGLAQLALYAQQLSNAKHEAAEYDNAIDSLNDALRTGLITQDEYNSMLYEYKSAQESAVSSVKDARDSILALVKDGIQAEIDARKEATDQAKAQLEAEEDLHNYQESIADKQSNIAKLQRQIAALSGSTDRKDMAQKLQLQQDLYDAQKDLYKTQRDHEFDERKNALDDEYNAFEESKQKEMEELETDLDKQEAAISKYLDKVKKDHSTAYDVLKQYGENYNLTATDDLTEPWESASSAADLCSDAIGEVTANIQYQINSLDFSSLYELVNLLNTIKGLGYGDSDATNSQWEDISGTGTWHKSTASGRWWYGADEDNYASDGIYTIDGKQYGFNGKGQMVTGWRNDIGDDGTWKYFEPSNGQMVRSEWRKSKDGTWYYLDHNGDMATDMAVKAKDGDGYYYVDNDGKWDGTTLSSEDVNRLKYKIGYKNGTTNATRGYHPVFEDGSEIITLKDGTVLYPFEGGETVLDHAKTEKFMNSLRTTMPRFTDGFKNSTLDNVKVKDVVQTINIDMPIGGVLDVTTAQVLAQKLPEYLLKNGKVICNMVAKDMTKSTRW
nr:hypothetical protein [Clostridium sp. Marseille-P7770]